MCTRYFAIHDYDKYMFPNIFYVCVCCAVCISYYIFPPSPACTFQFFFSVLQLECRFYHARYINAILRIKIDITAPFRACEMCVARVNRSIHTQKVHTSYNVDLRTLSFSHFYWKWKIVTYTSATIYAPHEMGKKKICVEQKKKEKQREIVNNFFFIFFHTLFMRLFWRRKRDNIIYWVWCKRIWLQYAPNSRFAESTQ